MSALIFSRLVIIIDVVLLPSSQYDVVGDGPCAVPCDPEGSIFFQVPPRSFCRPVRRLFFYRGEKRTENENGKKKEDEKDAP